MTPEEQKTFFFDQGYLVVEDVVSPEELAECEVEIHKLHVMAADLAANGDKRSGSFQREPYARDKEQEGLPVLRKIEQTRDFSNVFKNLAAHSKLVPVVQNLIGPDLLLFRSTLMLKPAFHVSSHGFHQDSAYWPMKPPALVTVSIALTRGQFREWLYSGDSPESQVGHAEMGRYCAASRCKVDRSKKFGYFTGD